MDGLLLDTERLARDAFVEACAELGWTPNLTGYARCIGTTYEATERILREVHGPEFPYTEIARRWGARYEARVMTQPVDKKPGAQALLERLAALGIPCALATSTERRITEAKLAHAALDGYFAHLVCGAEGGRGKPYPDPYRRAVDALGSQAAACWALEDSDNGVRAAHAAGLRVFQVPDLVAPSPEVRALGHAVVGSLREVLAILP